MDDHGTGEVVQSMFTETSVFVSPAGEQFPYVHMVCELPNGGEPVNLLFNPQMAVMLLDAVTRYMGTVFNVPEVGKSLEGVVSETMDRGIDWDEYPPPPTEPPDWYNGDEYEDIDPEPKQGE